MQVSDKYVTHQKTTQKSIINQNITIKSRHTRTVLKKSTNCTSSICNNFTIFHTTQMRINQIQPFHFFKIIIYYWSFTHAPVHKTDFWAGERVLRERARLRRYAHIFSWQVGFYSHGRKYYKKYNKIIINQFTEFWKDQKSDNKNLKQSCFMFFHKKCNIWTVCIRIVCLNQQFVLCYEKQEESKEWDPTHAFVETALKKLHLFNVAYVHRDRWTLHSIRDGEPRTSTSTFTQLCSC